jgi:hypothetical protein
MSAEEYRVRSLPSDCLDGAAQTPLIAFCAATGWAMRLDLAKWQIAAEDGHTDLAKGGCECDEQWRLAVCAGTVSEDEAVSGRMGRDMKIAPDGDCAGRRIFERPESELRGHSLPGMRCEVYRYTDKASGVLLSIADPGKPRTARRAG